MRLVGIRIKVGNVVIPGRRYLKIVLGKTAV